MKFIIGKKKEMTQIFNENGELIPATVVKAGPCVITQIKTDEKDKYSALQLGFEEKKKIKKALKGHLKNVGLNCRFLKEFRSEKKEFNIGDSWGVEIFEPGDIVDIIGNSKGKGFQGVVKRHNFGGSPATHGHKDQLRMPGSIGATDPARVFKGTRMGGRMGNDQITVKNLKVVKVDKENNLLFLKGAVPGAMGTLLRIKGNGEIKVRSKETAPEKKSE